MLLILEIRLVCFDNHNHVPCRKAQVVMVSHLTRSSHGSLCALDLRINLRPNLCHTVCEKNRAMAMRADTHMFRRAPELGFTSPARL